jgi:hypothetical protein
MSDYNGFTNWETWNLRNWMINEYPPAQPEGDTAQEIADNLREQHLDRVGDMPDGFERDALTATYEAVNWLELAETFTDE